MTTSREDELIIVMAKESRELYNTKYKNTDKSKIYKEMADFLNLKLISTLSRKYKKLITIFYQLKVV